MLTERVVVAVIGELEWRSLGVVVAHLEEGRVPRVDPDGPSEQLGEREELGLAAPLGGLGDLAAVLVVGGVDVLGVGHDEIDELVA